MKSIFDSSLSKQQIAKIIVSKYKESEIIEEMKIADSYYKVKNTNILDKKITYFDKDKNEQENPALANNKLASGFLRMLVEQKADYAFSKPFIIKLVSDSGEIDVTKDVKAKAYLDAWNILLKKQLFSISKSIAVDAINKGIGWAYVWINDEGDLRIVKVPSEKVYPIWNDGDHKIIDNLVYNFNVDVYKSSTPENVEYAEYWDAEENIKFNVTKNYEIEPEFFTDEGDAIFSHMVNSNNEGVSWGKIPYICFKGTEDETPLLQLIKDYIDSYDILMSQSVDGLENDLDPLLIVKGVSPEVNELMEARELAKVTKMMVVDSDGGAEYLQEKTDIEGNLKTASTLRHDIVTFGYGVDFEDARFGGNPNQMVVKSLYQNLDIYTNGLEKQFQEFINNLKYFFDKWLEFKGEGSFDELQKMSIIIKLDRSMMINSSALIEDAVKLTNTGISKETQLEFNPAVQDVELEKQRLAEEEKENMKKQEEFSNSMFKFEENEKLENEDDEEEEVKKEDKEEIKVNAKK